MRGVLSERSESKDAEVPLFRIPPLRGGIPGSGTICTRVGLPTHEQITSPGSARPQQAGS
ncbi:MAG: hypothetical protein ACRDGA_05695 [Bacteroidota bacterium]